MRESEVRNTEPRRTARRPRQLVPGAHNAVAPFPPKLTPQDSRKAEAVEAEAAQLEEQATKVKVAAAKIEAQLSRQAKHMPWVSAVIALTARYGMVLEAHGMLA